MRAAILSIGDELTLGQNVDTNSAWLSVELTKVSIDVVEHRTLPDDRTAIVSAIKELARICDVLIMTGGLGPTEDDLTREALNDAIAPSQPMVIDESALAYIRKIFERRGNPMPPMNHKQALRPVTGRTLPNPNGTAPGIAAEFESCKVFCLPGPPREMQPMFADHVRPALAMATGEEVLLTGQVQEFGMGESVAAEKISDLMKRDRNPLVGTTASDAIVSARIRVRGKRDWAQTELAKTIAFIEDAWRPYAFGRENDSLSSAAGGLLREGRLKLAVAESCTGGLLGKMIVDQPRSSDYFAGGWITYSNEMKSQCLDVDVELIATHGAVSREVACAMALGALRHSGADYALSITGIAGPDGGTKEKPVGTVHIALAGKSDRTMHASSRHFRFSGDRATVRDRSAKAALQMLRFALLDVPAGTPLLWEVLPSSVQSPAKAEAIRA